MKWIDNSNMRYEIGSNPKGAAIVYAVPENDDDVKFLKEKCWRGIGWQRIEIGQEISMSVFSTRSIGGIPTSWGPEPYWKEVKEKYGFCPQSVDLAEIEIYAD